MLETLQNINWVALGAAFGTGLMRSIGGWAENALKDQKITKFELAQLGATIVRVGLLTLGAYLGLDAFGIDHAELAAAGSAFVLDWIVRRFTKEPETKKK